MRISDLIACFINDALAGEDGCAELQRSELAQRFNCVPSQINYVIATRFSPEHGYIVESRRGGGGYIRIRRIRTDPRNLVIHTVNAIGEEIDCGTVRAFLSNLLGTEVIDQQSARLMEAALGDQALKLLPPELRDAVRADVFRQMLIQTVY
ncbi:MAG: CtsR family transcriptional regulator [Clostridiales bacterium]|nr:CtsR family transcriptional regulator [Clostridiales bacterium]